MTRPTRPLTTAYRACASVTTGGRPCASTLTAAPSSPAIKLISRRPLRMKSPPDKEDPTKIVLRYAPDNEGFVVWRSSNGPWQRFIVLSEAFQR